MSVDRLSDTIVAPITATGGAVALVRLSGPDSWRIAEVVFGNWPQRIEPRRATYGRFSSGDDGLVIPFQQDSSYTGEQVVEMSVHGSVASVQHLLDSCVGAGARMAEPGEFTLRAFMNGRMDLTQAEGVRDTVAAATDSQLRQANLMREGSLRDEVRCIRSEIEGVLAAVEASTDFSEEVGDLDRAAARNRCLAAQAKITALLATEDASRVVRDGASVAIVGLPNAGKSSLLNALIGADRAIVTEVPGTTRDTVEAELSWKGLLVRLIDTAGLRESDDLIESLGVERSRSAIENADVVLYIYDNAVGWQDEDDELCRPIGRPCIIVANKIDLNPHAEQGLPVSTVTGHGLERLVEAVRKLVLQEPTSPALINSRHAPLLQGAREALDRVHETLSCPVPDDLAAVDLLAAIRLLGEVTGETATPDVIDRIFHDFCIGK
ncbi:MAG: tRNA uridine-5-carboxymethylaminomethyl(34) synthesis GTPase MnmE [Armatimonadetes bacterium]|nr:tRNA uridine-5-carboxymethylaminomethyl(34) synthesis GTPase MnmE [Armatimonadota bacterium]